MARAKCRFCGKPVETDKRSKFVVCKACTRESRILSKKLIRKGKLTPEEKLLRAIFGEE